MKFKIFKICLIIIFLISCNQETRYIPNGLHKLTENELIERARDKELIDFKKVTFKNEKGETIAFDSVRNLLNMSKWAFDRYANDNGIIEELIFREATRDDKMLSAKLQQAYNYKPPIKIIDIDCKDKAEILENIYALDQGMRSDENPENYNPQTDRQNLVKVVSLIEQCGMPTTEEISTKQMSAIWLVFQHTDNYNRKKYFPILKKAAEKGDLKKSQIALMQDRILMMDGKPQVYGSQIIENQETLEWEIYDLENPRLVDKRRAKVGLGSLKEYAKNWNIKFNVKQKE